MPVPGPIMMIGTWGAGSRKELLGRRCTRTISPRSARNVEATPPWLRSPAVYRTVATVRCTRAGCTAGLEAIE
ncbi:MAG: hypothetical protein QOJ80_6459 [Mycobacterium sp.]|nr:hypothetical protein [Mycobacterium sp.]